MKKTALLTLLGLLLPASTVFASHPRYDQMSRVKTVAHEIQTAVHHAHKAAERSAHHRTHAEESALRSLHELNRQARHFHRQVERYAREPYHTEGDYRKLVDAYYQAEHAMRYVHSFEHVYRDFHQVSSLMNQLGGYYGGYEYRPRDYRDSDHHGYRYRRAPSWHFNFRWR